ncbi:hypothetical protein BH10BAC5_BH10BAC5_14360 [soil metagenome]
MKLKVLIVASYFDEEVAYQEVELANYLNKQGAKVTVLTSKHININLKTKQNRQNISEFEIIRLDQVLRIKDTIFPLTSLKKIIVGIDPDVALLILPGAGLPYFASKVFSKRTKVISFYSDIEVSDKAGAATTYKGNPLIKALLKNPWYNTSFKNSDVIVCNTNETIDILKKVSKSDISGKILMPGLGYDPQNYYYDEGLRKKVRKEFGIKEDEKLLITLTRMYSSKPLMKWFAPVLEAMKKNDKLYYIIAGFTDDEYPNKIKSILESEGMNRLLLLNFSDVKRNNELFNAADYSIWFAPTISIQQSMGTGLKAILPYDKTLDHIVIQDYNGKYYKELIDIPQVLETINEVLAERKDLADFNKRFSYSSIIEQIFKKTGTIILKYV